MQAAQILSLRNIAKIYDDLPELISLRQFTQCIREVHMIITYLITERIMYKQLDVEILHDFVNHKFMRYAGKYTILYKKEIESKYLIK